jgi:hypothetical protein
LQFFLEFAWKTQEIAHVDGGGDRRGCRNRISLPAESGTTPIAGAARKASIRPE